MPYKKLSDLPDSVRENLPRYAQEIYRSAFNNAWDQYSHQEETAHKVAWAAVKNAYEKNEKSGQWTKRK